MAYRFKILVAFILTLSGLAALTHPALAATLKSRILVQAPIVTVGDLFDGLEHHQERPLFRAPNPGTSGMLQVQQLRQVMRNAGIKIHFQTELSAIEVARTGQAITKTLAIELLTLALVQRGLINDDDEWSFSLQPLPDQLASDGTQPAFIDISSVSLVPSTGRVSAILMIPGYGRVGLIGTGTQMVEAVRLKNRFTAGDILTLNDVEIVKVPVQRVAHFERADIAAIVGKTVKFNRRAGSLLAQKDIVPTKIIKRGNLVTIKLTRGALSLTAQAQALEDGAENDLIRVLNLRSKRTITAQVRPDGTLSVPTPHQTQTPTLATQKLTGL